jgi:RimJ/RimL family protein N-acetyltransferase
VTAAYADPAIQRWQCRSMTDDEAGEWIDSWPGQWRDESGAGWAVLDAGNVAGQISLRRILLHRIELFHSTANVASCRVARHAGFTVEGTKCGEGRHTGGWHDMHLHSRLSDDA